MAIFVYFCKNPGEILKPFPLLKKSEITQHLCVKWSTRKICIIMYVVSPQSETKFGNCYSSLKLNAL